MISYIIVGAVLIYVAVVVVRKIKNKNGCGCGCSGDCTACRGDFGKD